MNFQENYDRKELEWIASDFHWFNEEQQKNLINHFLDELEEELTPNEFRTCIEHIRERIRNGTNY